MPPDEKAQLESEWRSIVLSMISELKTSTTSGLTAIKEAMDRNNEATNARLAALDGRVGKVETKLEEHCRQGEIQEADNKVEHRNYNQKIFEIARDIATVTAIIGLLVKLFVK